VSRSGIPDGLAVRGDPDEVAALSRELRRIADHVAECKDQLSAAAGNVDWSGEAADAYRDKLGSLPGELEKVHVSYQGVCWALSSYESSLRDLRGRSGRAGRRANDAQGRIEMVARAKRSGQPHDPRWDAEEQAARDDLHSAQRDAGNVHQEFEDAVRTCCNRIRGASDAGIRNSLGSGFERYVVDDAGGFVRDAAVDTAGFLRDVAVDTAHAFVDLAPALVNLAEHPLSADAWSRALDDATTVLWVASIFVPGLGEALFVASALQVAADVATHKPEKAFTDGLFLGLSGVSKVAGRAGGLSEKAARLERDHPTAARAALDSKVAAQLDQSPRKLVSQAVRSPFGWSTQRVPLAVRFRRHPVAMTRQLRHSTQAANRWFQHAWTPHGDTLPSELGHPAALRFHRVAFVADRIGDLSPFVGEKVAHDEAGTDASPQPAGQQGGW
jgi:hypothetical protein